MKVLFVSPGIIKNEDYTGYSLGGIEKQIFGIAKEISSKGHKVFIIRKRNGLLKQENVDGITLINVFSWPNIDSDLRLSPIYAFFSRLMYSKKVSNEIKKIKPDIVFINELISSIFILKLNLRKVYIVHIPPYELLKDNFSNKWLISSLFSILGKMENFILKRFDKIIALNSTINQYFQNKGYNSLYIPNGININDYDSGKDQNFILFGGRLVPEKGIIYLLQAFFELITSHRFNIKLLIVGSGPSEMVLKNFVEGNMISTWVEFIPWLNTIDFKRKLEECKIFILPSLFECMPVSLLEAMACGKPIIASDIPGPQDIIIHGYNGFLFEKGNSQELKKYLISLLENDFLRINMGKNAKLTIKERYSFEKVTEEYLRLIN